MTGPLASAARSLARSPGRSLSLAALMCAAFLALALMRAGYADMFDRIRASVARENGDIALSLSEGRGLSLAEYGSLKRRILADGRFGAPRASVPIDGLVGLGERSAPLSGVAVEDSDLAFDPSGPDVEAVAGEALARTLGAKPGDELSALIGDAGFSLRLADTVRTEAAMLDRFFLRIPLEALDAEDGQWRVDRIGVWLVAPDVPVLEALRELESWPELEGYASSAYELGNTAANGVVNVYEESFRVVLAAVVLAMLLALCNATLLSSWERGAEWGTMLALGAPFASVAAALVLEASLLSAAASAAGTVLALAFSALANLAGGIAFPPPPTQVQPLIVRFKPEASALALAFGLSIACSVVAAGVAAMGIRRRSVVELLFERN